MYSWCRAYHTRHECGTNTNVDKESAEEPKREEGEEGEEIWAVKSLSLIIQVHQSVCLLTSRGCLLHLTVFIQHSYRTL